MKICLLVVLKSIQSHKNSFIKNILSLNVRNALLEAIAKMVKRDVYFEAYISKY